MNTSFVIHHYTALKEALLEAFDKTPAQWDREFISIKSLGDLTPTAMLRKMRRLRPKSEHSSMLFRFGFLRILPSEVSNILVVLDDAPLDELAKKADKILEQSNDAPGSVAAIRGEVSSLPPSFPFSMGEVDAVKQFFCGGRVPSASNSAPQARGGSRGDVFTCNSHAKWGTKAYSCKPGCLFSDLPLNKRTGNSNAGR